MPLVNVSLSLDDVMLDMLITEMTKVAGKAGANWGKSPEQSVMDKISKTPRDYWYQLTVKLQVFVDYLVDCKNTDETEIISVLNLDFHAQDFLVKELAAMSQRVGKEAWAQFDEEIRNKYLERTSFVIYELRRQIAGVEQLRLFNADNINIRTFSGVD